MTYTQGERYPIPQPSCNDTPKLWQNMTPEEKGALLLAKHEGKVIEQGLYIGAESEYWRPIKPSFMDGFTYRIKPEPKRESHNLFVYTRENDYLPTPIGTIDLIDGKPDPESIKIGE